MGHDVLVIGGGILGFSSAYHLKLKHPDDKIVVIDKNPGPGQGNTAKSEGAFRNVFASQTNFLLADSTIDWLDHVQRDLGHDLGLHYVGYLWLFSEAQYERLSGTLRLMSERGIELRALRREEIHDCLPDLVARFAGDEDAELMDLEPVDIGIYAPKCGSVDADAVCRFYESEFIKLGGEVKYSTKVTRLLLKPKPELDIPGEPFIWQKKTVAGAKTERGTICADTTVLATGAWAEELLSPIGVDPMMRPKKRQLFIFKDERLSRLFKIKGLSREGVLPLTILPSCGIYLKADLTEGNIWLGCADNFGRGFGLEEEPEAEEDYYLNNLYHVVVKYFPCFSNIRPINMWAGQYAINGQDMTPIVAPFPGMIYVGAASGSGIMKCDAIGRITEAVYDGKKKVNLYGDVEFNVADVGLASRSVEKETFVI